MNTTTGMPEPILLRDAKEPSGGSGTLIQPVVLASQPTIWFGDGGSGKSYLALAAGLSIHAGADLLGGLAPRQPVRVAYLDWESDAWDHCERMRRMMSGAELPDIVYVPCHGLPLSRQVERLRQILGDNQVGFVVIDSLALACDGAPEDSQAATTFFNALHRLGIGALCLAHVNRGGDTERPFGSTFWHNGARMTWYVKASENDDNSLTVTMHNRKASGSAKSAPIAFRIDFRDSATTISLAAARAEQAAGKKSLGRRMEDALRTGALTYEELAERVDSEPDTVRRTATRRTDRFVILKSSRPHRIALKANESDGNPDKEPDNLTGQSRTTDSVSASVSGQPDKDKGSYKDLVRPVSVPPESEP